MKLLKTLVVVLLTAFSINAKDDDEKDKDKDKKVSLPEPSAIPESLLGLTGIGLMAWRYRNRKERATVKPGAPE